MLSTKTSLGKTATINKHGHGTLSSYNIWEQQTKHTHEGSGQGLNSRAIAHVQPHQTNMVQPNHTTNIVLIQAMSINKHKHANLVQGKVQARQHTSMCNLKFQNVQKSKSSKPIASAHIKQQECIIKVHWISSSKANRAKVHLYTKRKIRISPTWDHHFEWNKMHGN
jgi:hypothetical protein